MSTHNMHFHGEIRKIKYFLLLLKKVPYLELWFLQPKTDLVGIL